MHGTVSHARVDIHMCLYTMHTMHALYTFHMGQLHPDHEDSAHRFASLASKLQKPAEVLLSQTTRGRVAPKTLMLETLFAKNMWECNEYTCITELHTKWLNYPLIITTPCVFAVHCMQIAQRSARSMPSTHTSSSSFLRAHECKKTALLRGTWWEFTALGYYDWSQFDRAGSLSAQVPYLLRFLVCSGSLSARPEICHEDTRSFHPSKNMAKNRPSRFFVKIQCSDVSYNWYTCVLLKPTFRLNTAVFNK